MNSDRPPVLRSVNEPMSAPAFSQHARMVVAHHGERILAEVPKTLRRIGLFFLITAISIPVFMVGLLVVLWHLGH